MAEFWTGEQRPEPSSVKIVKPPSSAKAPAAGSESGPVDPPTILSSFKPPSAVTSEPGSLISKELAGEMLGHYRLDDYVGVGGMGAVFRATDIRLDRAVALKILPPEQARDADIVARFQQEARAAARLDHENIARVFFVGEDRGLHFIAFEFVEGVNVRDLIQQLGPLPPAEVVNYALQITGALMHAASRGVVHRDIKPSNIIITWNGRAKLVDMGLARNFERRRDGGLTQSGVTLGTFDYISPEQARDPRAADVRSDIYSLGCTLFHMLTGRPPYPEGTVLQKLLKHQEDSPPDLRSLNARVPANLAGVVSRMMAKDPARRYQSAEELLSELLEIAAAMGLRSTSPEGLIWVTDESRSPMTRTTWAVWLTAAAALVLAAIGLYGRPGAPPAPTPAAGTRQDAALPAGPVIRDGSPARPNENHADTVERPTASNAAGDREEAAVRDSETAIATKPESPRAAAIEETSAARDQSQVIKVGAEQDLRAAIEAAPSGSLIELAGQHRPQTLHRVDDTVGIRLQGKRLTIRAAPGESPRIVIAHDEQDAAADWTMFRLAAGSQVEFEGIQFEIDSAAARVPMRMFELESSQVTLRRCSMFQGVTTASAAAAGPIGDSVVWLAHLDSGIGVNGQALASGLTAKECFFGGGDGAFDLEGAARLDLWDCTLLPYRSAVRVNSLGFPEAMAADVRLTNVSWFANDGPVFDLQFARASVTAQEVVFSHEGSARGVLARVDSDSGLEWKGRHNLYHGIRSYLVSRSGNEVVASAIGLAEWKTSAKEIQEQDSTEVVTSPWVITLSEAAAKKPNDPRVSDAFRLTRDAGDLNWRPIGARVVLPWGMLYRGAQPDLTGGHGGAAMVADEASGAITDPAIRRPAAEVKPDQTASVESPGGASPPASGASEATPGRPLNMKKIMDTVQPGEAASSGANSSAAPSDTNTPAAAAPADRVLVVDPQNRAAFATLAAACAKAEDGAVIEIRSPGKLLEGPIELGDRHLTIRAATGVRPTIEFVVDRLALDVREPRLFSIRRGSLALRELDFRVFADPVAVPESWGLVASRGADISLDNCSVTVEMPPGLPGALVRFLSTEAEDPMAAPMGDMGAGRMQLHAQNSFLVGPGSLVRAPASARVRVELENCAIEVQENLWNVLGGTEKSVPSGLHELEVRHSTIRTQHGLIHYESSEARPWLPRLEVRATDNIFVGGSDADWVRFRSPRAVDDLRTLFRWKGTNNSYDGSDSFWAIESMSGGEPERYRWESWLTSPARDEIKADRAALSFVAAADSGPVWLRTRRHFTISPTGSAMPAASDGGNRGVDVGQLPAPSHEHAAEER